MADDIIRGLRSQFQIGRDLADDAADLIERLCAAGDALVALIDGSIEWDTPYEESSADGVIAAWEEARRGR